MSQGADTMTAASTLTVRVTNAGPAVGAAEPKSSSATRSLAQDLAAGELASSRCTAKVRPVTAPKS